MERLNLPEGEPIEAGMVTRSIESAQRKVEARNFDVRKQLLEYDDVSNDQRKVIYAQRNEILEADNISDIIENLRNGVFTQLFYTYVPEGSMEEQWELATLENILRTEWHIELSLSEMLAADSSLDEKDLLAKTLTAAKEAYQSKVEQAGTEAFGSFERSLLLNVLDNHWREHLSALDHLRQGIHLRGYAQKNPKQEYKREAFELFAALLESVKSEVIRVIMNIRIQNAEQLEEAEEKMEERAAQSREQAQYQHAEAEEQVGEPAETKMIPIKNELPKIGRNDPCPCGSGKKYKQCHGLIA